MRLSILFLLAVFVSSTVTASNPNFVLVMTDDQGWGQTSYYNHPVLKTPELDKMAASGLRFDRFYAGAPVCSPTRAAVLTGRGNERAGVPSHGYALRRQEITLPQMLKAAGYVTGHFGKWHLNGLRGPGVPILDSDDHNPGEFGFDAWLSVTNFFDRNPIMSRRGKFVEFEGDSSEIVVQEACDFISRQASNRQPFLTVIWFGTPHDPFLAADDDMTEFSDLDRDSQHHYGELVAMDRSIGALRKKLRDLEIEKNTLVWFCSDNGGLPKIKPDTTGGLRGNKGTIYEGGLRVPGIIEWPGKIAHRVTNYPASVLDIVPTVLEIANTQHSDSNRPADGVSLVSLFEKEIGPRSKPIPFRQAGRGAWIDNDFKLLSPKLASGKFELYDLRSDPKETLDLSQRQPKLKAKLLEQYLAWSKSVDESIAGKDYPEGKVNENEPAPRFWWDDKMYQPYLKDWSTRWEYKRRLEKRKKNKKSSGSK